MSIMTAIRTGVKALDKVGETGGLKSTVYLQRFLTEPGQGNATYGQKIKLKAFVDWKAQQVRTKEGELSVTRAVVIFTDKATLMAKTANKGIGDNDKITLQDGTTGPILDLGGYIDPGDGTPVATEVMLG